MASSTNGMSLSKFCEIVKHREAWCTDVHGITERHDLVTKQQKRYMSGNGKDNENLLYCVTKNLSQVIQSLFQFENLLEYSLHSFSDTKLS